MCSRFRSGAAAAVLALALLAACEREHRELRTPPSGAATVPAIRVSGIVPGPSGALPDSIPAGPSAVDSTSPYDENAYAISEGKRLYSWMNCIGCHGEGGGAIGPPLMDQQWIYGGAPANIYATIVEGRPNGMPSFGGRLTDDDVWKLVAYVRSMSAQPSKAARPGRNDDMQSRKSEQRELRKPVQNAVPKPAGASSP
jgi:cytochrome c oxidase cbb3-type subunit 3